MQGMGVSDMHGFQHVSARLGAFGPKDPYEDPPAPPRRGVSACILDSPSAAVRSREWSGKMSDRAWLHADGSIFRDPAGWGYPDLPAGTVRDPKFGYIFVENRDRSKRRTKLVVRRASPSRIG